MSDKIKAKYLTYAVRYAAWSQTYDRALTTLIKTLDSGNETSEWWDALIARAKKAADAVHGECVLARDTPTGVINSLGEIGTTGAGPTAYIIYWRGSVSDLVTDILCMLPVQDQVALAKEFQDRIRESKL